MLAYSFSGKVSTLLAVIRAYSFIKFEEKIPAYSFISAYSFIRELRVFANGEFQQKFLDYMSFSSLPIHEPC